MNEVTKEFEIFFDKLSNEFSEFKSNPTRYIDDKFYDDKVCKNPNIGLRPKDGMFDTCRIIPKRIVVLEQGDMKTVIGIILHQTSSDLMTKTLKRWELENKWYESKVSAKQSIKDRLPEIKKYVSNQPKYFQSFENLLVDNILKKYADSSTTKDSDGAHFLISSSGVIYQTARVDKICNHVGPYIRPRCLETQSCGKDINQLYSQLQNKERLQDTLPQEIAEKLSIGGNPDRKIWAEMTSKEIEKPPDQRYPRSRDSIGIEVVGAPNSRTGEYMAPNAAQIDSVKWIVKVLMDCFKLKPSQVFAHGRVGPHKEPSEGTHIPYL